MENTKVNLMMVVFLIPMENTKEKKTNGSIYSPHGKFLGKIESSGKIYDPYGKYKGKIENNKKIFDLLEV